MWYIDGDELRFRQPTRRSGSSWVVYADKLSADESVQLVQRLNEMDWKPRDLYAFADYYAAGLTYGATFISTRISATICWLARAAPAELEGALLAYALLA